jgi:cellulose synthase/poly-beta-1,6-N-acetylglucosamine synthase-like glycosyltransferase
LDADHRPRPDALKNLVRYFCAPRVAGVSGRTIPLNGLASPSAFYSAVESSVHQMVTTRAKDRLDLAPALLGSNCGYRRTVLVRCGGFQPGTFLEDIDLTVRLSAAGYTLRFADDAIAFCQVPETRRGYLKQHARWARGYNDVAGEHALALARQSTLRPLLRAELILFALGYLDRLALLGAGILSSLSLLDPHRLKFPRWVLFLSLVTPLIQVIAVFIDQRAAPAMWLRLPLLPLMFLLDVYASLRAMMDSLLRRSHTWTQTERALRDE